LENFADIIGGEYLVTRNDELYFKPKGKPIKLTMDESSSAVRSLLDIGFYLRHLAKTGDLLIVDEPELNLHPENQRRIARLFARLVMKSAHIDPEFGIEARSFDKTINDMNRIQEMIVWGGE
jgi:predicted ATPase